MPQNFGGAGRRKIPRCGVDITKKGPCSISFSSTFSHDNYISLWVFGCLTQPPVNSNCIQLPPLQYYHHISCIHVSLSPIDIALHSPSYPLTCNHSYRRYMMLWWTLAFSPRSRGYLYWQLLMHAIHTGLCFTLGTLRNQDTRKIKKRYRVAWEMRNHG